MTAHTSHRRAGNSGQVWAVLYLLMIAGDAAATAAKVTGNASLMWLGLIARFIDAVFLPLTALTLYLLLRHAGTHAARLMVGAV